MRKVMVVFLLTAFAFGLDFHQVNVKVEMGKLIVDGKVYTLTGDLVVENQRGEPLTLDSLQYARSLRLEFDSKGQVKRITILGWWD